MAKTSILIDGDVLIHTAAVAAQQEVCADDHGWEWSLTTDMRTSTLIAKKLLKKWIEECDVKDYALSVAVSCAAEGNFRKLINPGYKSNREKTRKPLALKQLREWVLRGDPSDDERPWKPLTKPGLEADDILGILATKPKRKTGTIIVSIDKDLTTIPGRMLHLRPGEQDDVLVDTDLEAADRFFYAQCIAGDAVDGFAGAKGFGLETAYKLLDNGQGLVPYDHTLKSGKNKGKVVTRYQEVDMPDPWDIIMSCYQSAGQTEEDALLNSRMARILRWPDYDHKKQRPILWTPEKLKLPDENAG